ncbi:NADH:flavin oxidoreductase/NADH oxidase [Ascoidea rubescens DSM 1968]|uniref:NADH:flavin oxidoreductase/NADH oxidase n=1 Tax=Ascoidea rubescens DSM 1968 TaxID=1344418 RepID=A0A1D2VBH4_9ASCO|nr:NADH:flavin oxidoreductase/NADH oxidase [Ascoidea rubescens DSM 1968]ODV58955.1 NADH:flavin oxidoreductase/NADH oxidase [Ascoidea rubescens DSM 1968]
MVDLIDTNLFQPITVGNDLKLNHRIVFAPLTRRRATKDHLTNTKLMEKYYDDRSKTPGSLIITEGTLVSPFIGGSRHAPGIWNEAQVNSWKQIIDRVHENGSYVSMQLWGLGSRADPECLAEEGQPFLSVVDDTYPDELIKEKALKVNNPLKAMEISEIKKIVNLYANAAKNAIKAGADIVEIHASHNYIIDQFTSPDLNKRTDEYGGSIENRSRFLFEIIDAVKFAVGDSKKVAIRLSPWYDFDGKSGYRSDPHPIVTYGYIISKLQKKTENGNDLAYLSIVEPRVNGNRDADIDSSKNGNNDWILKIWKGTILRSGGYLMDKKEYKTLVEDVNANNRTLIGIGRYFTSNPDLVQRLLKNYGLTEYDRSTFYTFESYEGYNSWKSYKRV